MTLDADSCYRALQSRDARFDGMFFVAVETTGVYCRPICPARIPARARCAFYRRAAEAERAGFRACFRCRPELAPGPAAVDAVPRLVREAVLRIEAGALNTGSVDDLAAELGVTARHLRRALEAELGVTPVELAQTKRLALAKQLLQGTALPITDVAYASGFASLRRFNAAFRERFRRAPSDVRRRTHDREIDDTVQLRLDYRPPLDWERLVGFLGARAIPGVEAATQGRYLRSGRIDGTSGWLSVKPVPGKNALALDISIPLLPVLPAVLARARSIFDLDARPDVIGERLSKDPLLKDSLERRSGLRVPGAFDGFELAVRAILGQQVSVRGATRLAGRFVERFGKPLQGAPEPLSRLFPTAAEIASVEARAIAGIGMPATRGGAIQALAKRIRDGGLDLSYGADPERAAAELAELPGIGPWTAQYIALRALRVTDAFPGGDLVVRRALGVTTSRQAEARTEAWRPWRAYGVLHLWSMQSEGDGHE